MSNIMCTFSIKYYIIHLFFYITIFIFLVSRPTIDYLRNYSFNTYQKDAYVFAFIIVMISLLGLFIGGIISKALLKIKEKGYVIEENILCRWEKMYSCVYS